jgi:hypothetical protein
MDKAVVILDCTREVTVSNLGRKPTLLTEYFRGFSQFLQVNVGFLPHLFNELLLLTARKMTASVV